MKIAINGFGRIGRLAFRQIFDNNGIEIAAINDLTSPDMLAYLLKYDSVQGQFKNHEVTSDDTAIIVDDVRVPVYSDADASKLPWRELGIDIVLECTGFFTSKAKSQAHINAGARKVLISAPAGDDLPTIVYGVNHDKLTKEDNIVSGASYREVRTGFMTTIHAYTGDQKILDSPHKKGNKRRARAGAVNIVPNSTGAAKAIGLVIPELDGKLIGSAQRVPVPSGSITILDATLKDETETVTVEGINEIMRKESNESFGYTEEEIVSSDIIGMSYGSLFDATQTLAQRCGTKIYEVRVVAWYDNEASYTSQLVRTLKHMGTLL